MNLAPCPDCGNSCSLLAQACPTCGRPFKPGELKPPAENPPEADARKPSAASTNVLLENLKETLKGTHWYFLSGTVTALFILLLAARGRLAVGAVEQEVKPPFVDLSTTQFGAALIALAIYILSGWMIFGFIKHIRRIKGELTRLKEKELLNATLTYPSMLTTGRRAPVVITLLVAALGTLAMLASYYASRGFLSALMTGIIVSHPYFFVALTLLHSPLVEPDKT